MPALQAQDLIPKTKELNRKEDMIQSQSVDLSDVEMPQVYTSMEQAEKAGEGFSYQTQQPAIEITEVKEPWTDLAKSAGLIFAALAIFGWIVSKLLVKRYGHLVDSEDDQEGNVSEIESERVKEESDRLENA